LYITLPPFDYRDLQSIDGIHKLVCHYEECDRPFRIPMWPYVDDLGVAEEGPESGCLEASYLGLE